MENLTNEIKPCVLLLTTSRSYRNEAFLSAAERLGIDIVLAVDGPKALSRDWPGGFHVDFRDKVDALEAISSFDENRPLSAILAVDDSGGRLASAAAAALGLPHNDAKATEATRDKLFFRRLLEESPLNSPAYAEFLTGSNIDEIVSAVGFPCVVKPRNLNGSRGVIRANNREQLQEALDRSARLVRSVMGVQPDAAVSLLIESYIPGTEVALEGILDNGRLTVLALFDKPDPLEGPFFEETIYLTPSRLPAETQEKIAACVSEAAAVSGLETGPVHAELRLNARGPWLIEIAGRSIGGLCSRILQFGMNGSLEETILRQACAMPFRSIKQTHKALGVMMIPIPGAGLLRRVHGLERARAVAYVDNIEITAPFDNPVTPLPEGDGYLGFIFAKGPSLNEVEDALRKAHQELAFDIETLLPVLNAQMNVGTRNAWERSIH